MGTHAKNIISINQHIEIKMDTKDLVLIDLLVLDGLSREFSSSPDPIAADALEYLTPFSSPMRIGIYEIHDFEPGTYRFSTRDLMVVDPENEGSHVVDIDTGELVLVDFSHLSAVAKNLTWDMYDLYLQAPMDDDSIIVAINKKIGGEYFGIMTPDEDTEFDGDGSFAMKPGAGERIGG